MLEIAQQRTASFQAELGAGLGPSESQRFLL